MRAFFGAKYSVVPDVPFGRGVSVAGGAVLDFAVLLDESLFGPARRVICHANRDAFGFGRCFRILRNTGIWAVKRVIFLTLAEETEN